MVTNSPPNDGQERLSGVNKAREPLKARDVSFLLLPLPEFTMLPFGGFVDKLRFSADEADYSRQRYCNWQVLGLDAGTVTSSSGIAIDVQVTADRVQLSEYDYLVVFGSRTARGNLAVTEAYAGLLRKAVAQGLTLVSVDNACFLLAACGLLTGHKVALHWRHEQEFRTIFPRIEVRSAQLYCLDGKRVTCGGGSAAIDLAVELLARHCGRTRALKGLADMLVDETRGQLHQLKSLDEEVVLDRHIGRAISLMRNLMAEQKTTDEIAALMGIGRRQLDRLFKSHYNQTAHCYWTEMRLQHVHWRLINSNHSLAILADEIGVGDVSYLCKLVRKRFGQSPGELRNQ